MAFAEKRVERFAEPIVVEFFSGDVPEQFGAGIGGPFGNVDESEGAEHSSRDEYGEDVPVLEFGLRIGGEMLVDDLGDVHPLQQRRNNGKRSDVTSFDVGVGLISIPRCSVHLRNMANPRKAS